MPNDILGGAGGDVEEEQLELPFDEAIEELTEDELADLDDILEEAIEEIEELVDDDEDELEEFIDEVDEANLADADVERIDEEDVDLDVDKIDWTASPEEINQQLRQAGLEEIPTEIESAGATASYSSVGELIEAGHIDQSVYDEVAFGGSADPEYVVGALRQANIIQGVRFPRENIEVIENVAEELGLTLEDILNNI